MRPQSSRGRSDTLLTLPNVVGSVAVPLLASPVVPTHVEFKRPPQQHNEHAPLHAIPHTNPSQTALEYRRLHSTACRLVPLPQLPQRDGPRQPPPRTPTSPFTQHLQSSDAPLSGRTRPNNSLLAPPPRNPLAGASCLRRGARRRARPSHNCWDDGRVIPGAIRAHRTESPKTSTSSQAATSSAPCPKPVYKKHRVPKNHPHRDARPRASCILAGAAPHPHVATHEGAGTRGRTTRPRSDTVVRRTPGNVASIRFIGGAPGAVADVRA